MYIVMEDETLPKRLSAVGEEGELWIGGVGVAKGYLHAPDLTAKVFLENPFGDGPVYRTGDIVKRLNVSQQLGHSSTLSSVTSWMTSKQLRLDYD